MKGCHGKDQAGTYVSSLPPSRQVTCVWLGRAENRSAAARLGHNTHCSQGPRAGGAPRGPGPGGRRRPDATRRPGVPGARGGLTRRRAGSRGRRAHLPCPAPPCPARAGERAGGRRRAGEQARPEPAARRARTAAPCRSSALPANGESWQPGVGT